MIIACYSSMSTTEEEEHKEVVKRDPTQQPQQQPAPAPNQPAPGQPAAQAPAAPSSPIERKEVVERRKSTNIGALVAIGIGIVVLVAGIGLIFSQVPFLPWPYSIVVTLGLGLILLIIGASFISSRTSTTAA